MAVIVPIIAGVIASAALTIALAWIVGPNNQSNFGDKMRLPGMQTSGYGIAITRLIGQARIAGNVIWQQTIQYQAVTASITQSSGILKPSSTISNTTYLPYLSFAVAICSHQIQAITRIWADDVLIFDSVNNPSVTFDSLGITVYYGTEAQGISPLIESIDGVGTHPAYRGLAYVTFANFHIERYGHLPNMFFEVEGL